ncbi:MAG: hypothetical protein GY927_18805 [bacterium]|nr:hypothetical protein [bacterium]
MSISGVTQASQDVSAASGQVTSAAGELSRQSTILKSVVDQFLLDLRKGTANRRLRDDPNYKGSERRDAKRQAA